jgi:class 3 adenylate cyclase
MPGDVVTIAFTDLEGYTTFASQAERDDVRELILDYHALVREQVSRRGGFEVKQTGDGFMVAFSSATRAVQFAVDVQRAMEVHRHPHRLRVCIGLNSGEAIREGSDFFGHTVNIASRIADRAVGGQVLASEQTRVFAGFVEGVSFVDAGRRSFRGLPGRHRLYEVRWAGWDD